METKELDKTIERICKWIQDGLENGNSLNGNLLPEMTKALAALISARAQLYS